MEQFIAFMAATVPTYILVMSRTLGLFLQAPVLSDRNHLPAPIRMALTSSLSVIIMTLLPVYPAIPNMLIAFILMAMNEFMLGAIFGFAANFMFLAMQSAGELGGVQAGLSAASVQNPFTKSNVNALGTLYFYIGLMVFLMIGGHLWMLGGFIQSFQLVPIGTFILTPAASKHFFEMSGSFLAITIQLALPMVIVVFIAELGVGYMSKVAQQASSLTQDLVTIAKPVSGMILLLLLLPNIMSMAYQYTETTISDLNKFLRISAQGRPLPPRQGP